ncbi:hypothetical protein ACHAWF_007183 [Thalassiosira exigua]
MSCSVNAPSSCAQDHLAELSERLRSMRTREATRYAVPDYLSEEWQRTLTEGEAADEEPRINESWRGTICGWMYEVADHFEYSREVVSVAMSYLDRYLSKHSVNRRMFQLAAMTALYLAVKVMEPRKISAAGIVGLSRGYFVEEHIKTMENAMLRSLEWSVLPPTPFGFVQDLVKLLSGDVKPRDIHEIAELARFQTELSVCDYFFVTKKPSSIALASILKALEPQKAKCDGIDADEFLRRVVDVGFDIVDEEEIFECYERLGEYEANVESSNSQAVDANADPAAAAQSFGRAASPDTVN